MKLIINLFVSIVNNLPFLVSAIDQRRPFSQTQKASLFIRFGPVFHVKPAPLIQCFYKTAEHSNNLFIYSVTFKPNFERSAD